MRKIITTVLLAAVLAAVSGCVTAESDHDPKPKMTNTRGMSPGMEMHTSTGVRVLSAPIPTPGMR